MSLKKNRVKAAKALRKIGVPFILAHKIVGAVRSGGIFAPEKLPGVKIRVVEHLCHCGIHGCCSHEVFVVGEHGEVEILHHSVGGFEVS